MAEVFLFTVVAVALYFTADWLLRLIEERRGGPLPNRGLIYFVVIFVLAVASFEVIQRTLSSGAVS